MGSTIELRLNGTPVRAEVSRGATLIDFLRDERGLVGTKNGCGVGQCGSCTVLVNGEIRRACVTRVEELDGAEVETIEAMAPGGGLHPIQRAFVDEGAVQCGFCIPGMVMATRALLAANPQPSEPEIRAALDPNLCRCTGYTAIVRAVQRAAGVPVTPAAGAAAPELTAPREGVVGQSVLKTDALTKVTGEPLFADDYRAPGTLYGALVFSEQDHARLTAVNTAEAAAADGVVRVFTAADIPGRNGFGLQLPHQPVLAGDLVRYRGEPIALVIAENARQARRAARLVRGEYDPLPVLHSPAEALAKDAPQLHPEGNVAETVRFRRGDPDAAFAKADLIVEGEYHTHSNEHAYLEPESCLALPGANLPDGWDDPAPAGAPGRSPRVTVFTANQGSGAFQQMISASLAIEPEDVRVVYTPAGGGFGGKEEPTVQIHAALAAVALNRPVKITLDRAASLRISTKRHASTIRIRHAVRADGTLLAVETRTVCDAGAYLSLTRPVVFRTAVMAGGPYEVPNADVESVGVYTNTNPSGAFRGFGSTQICFAVEVQMDKIARHLGIDPIELRRRNALGPGKVTVTGHRLSAGVGYPQTIEAVAAALQRARAEIKPAPGKKLGVGFASAYKNVGIGKGMPDEASAAVALGADGTVTVFVGATDIGQGSDTVMAQIAAQTLGVEYDAVRVVSSDTAHCPDAGMTTASRQTFISGNAVAGAAVLLRDRLGLDEDIAAPLTRAALASRYAELSTDGAGETGESGPTGEQLDPEGLRVEYRYRPPATVKLPEVFTDATAKNPEGFPIHFAYCYTSMAAIIEVNPDGSDLVVKKLITAQDVGRALHPQNVLGQVEGAAVMGYGFAVRERWECGRNGTPTASLKALGIPRFCDSPALESYIVEEVDPNGPFGAKGIGEIPLNPAAPAIASAIHDALGFYPERLPIAPDGTVRR
ncbi:MAG: xanthine dehydrogenase [Spirochaetaceae bacterium]|nr:MAG: xanthine dehydrogenase [Spirochaetaceae bacterium]